MASERPEVPALVVEAMGRVDYPAMHALQLARQREVAEGRAPETLFLLEHPPVYTTGTSGGTDHVLWDAAERARRGIDLVATGRGGDVTYHGPGQLVAYPILRLAPGERDLRQLVGRLEAAVIDTVAQFGVTAGRVEGLRGVWVGEAKLAAVGVRVSRWTSCHGIALNVDLDLGPFAGIVACGLHGRGVTSLARLCDPCPSLAAVAAALVPCLARAFGRRAQAGSPSALPTGAACRARAAAGRAVSATAATPPPRARREELKACPSSSA